MEISMKTGKGMKCPYTGEETEVLVTISGDGETKAGQLSEQALIQALKFVQSYKASMGQPVVPVQVTPVQSVVLPSLTPANTFMQTPAQELQSEQYQQIAQGVGQMDPPQLIAQFEKALNDLMTNPPDDQQGRTQGLAEVHVRELITRFKTSFRNPLGSMAPSLTRIVGMPRDRVQLLLS